MQETKARPLRRQVARNTAISTTKPAPIELVFGVVGPTGVDVDAVVGSLSARLKALDYEYKIISLSNIILEYDGSNTDFKNAYEKITKLMDLGDDIRSRSQQPNMVALLGLMQLRATRAGLTGDPEKPPHEQRIAYIIRSFKRPEEVQLFRDAYGKAFTLISIYSPRSQRINNLRKRCEAEMDANSSEELAIRLINRDYKDNSKKFGQRMGETFPLADFFVKSEPKQDLHRQLKRLVRLTFGDPYISPTKDEQGMFFAQAAALRSLDLSRQVGAAIISADGEMLTTGCNEVPRPGGGLYWEDDSRRARDYERGADANVGIKAELLADTIEKLRIGKWLSKEKSEASVETLVKSLLFSENPILKGSKLFDVIEFGRAVHAEMAAISQAARAGISIQNGRLFCTTFPCHICARHIVASGVKEVIFIEPYEKSRVGEMYPDSICIENQDDSDSVRFNSFTGVAPRRYMDFFQLTSSRKKGNGEILDYEESAQNPKVKRIVFTHTLVEARLIEMYSDQLPSKKVIRKRATSTKN